MKRSRFISLHASNEEEFYSDLQKKDEETEKLLQKTKKEQDDQDENEDFSFGFSRKRQTKLTKKASSKLSNEYEDIYDQKQVHKGKLLLEALKEEKEEKNQQYFLDNDQCLGVGSNEYSIKTINQNTEEEDSKELENLIETINKIYKTKENERIDENDSIDNDKYTEILCKYFKMKLIMYSIKTKSEHKDSNLSLLSNNDSEELGIKKFGKTNPSKNLKDCKEVKDKRSNSINFLSEISLSSLISSIILSNKKQNLEKLEKASQVKSKSDNKLTSDTSTIQTTMKPVGNIENLENIENIISQNTEVEQTLKVLLIGDNLKRAKFLRALKFNDNKIDYEELSRMTESQGNLDIIKEKVIFFNRPILLQIFSTNISFFKNQLSSTYFKLCNSILFIADTDNQINLDSFFYIQNKILNSKMISKLYVITWNSIIRNGSIDLSESLHNKTRKSLRMTEDDMIKTVPTVKKISNIFIPRLKSKFIQESGMNLSKCAKFNAMIKIYNTSLLNITSFSEVSMTNQKFLHFIGLMLFNKMKNEKGKLCNHGNSLGLSGLIIEKEYFEIEVEGEKKKRKVYKRFFSYK